MRNIISNIKIYKRRKLVFMVLLLTGFSSSTFGQLLSTEFNGALKPAEKTMLMCTREIRLKEGVDPEAFEKWVIEYWNPEWRDLIPGFQSYVDKRSSGQGTYEYIYILEVNNPKPAFNVADKDNETIDWYRELIYYKPTKYLYEELFEYIEADTFFNKRICFDKTDGYRP